jgi:hypothetical protein
VAAGGVPAHWLTAPGTDAGRVLLFLHGGGYEFGSVRSDGELAARLGRASGMRVLFPGAQRGLGGEHRSARDLRPLAPLPVRAPGVRQVEPEIEQDVRGR